MPSPGIIAASSTRAVGTRSTWGWPPESDGGTRLSFPSRDPGPGVHQPNVVVGLSHGRAPLRAPRPRGPRPANRWSSRATSGVHLAVPPLSHQNSVVCGNRVRQRPYSTSLTGMRRRACVGVIDPALYHTPAVLRMLAMMVAVPPRHQKPAWRILTLRSSLTVR